MSPLSANVGAGVSLPHSRDSSGNGSPPHPATLTMQSHATSCAVGTAHPVPAPRRCQPSQAPCPQPRQALLPCPAAGTHSSANIFFLLSLAQRVPCNPTGSKGKMGNWCQDRVGIWPPTPGEEMFSHQGSCLLLLPASPPAWPPTAAGAAHTSPSSCGSRLFTVCSEQK